MKVLVVGGGGRCHAIADALRRSPKVEKIYVAPGNAGTAEVAENVPLKDTDVQGLLAFAQKKDIDLTVVGPEAALQAGIVDEFRSHGLRIFGPTAAAARIETSKEFAKELMMRYDIPTAAYRPFDDYREALDYVASRPLPAVLKYDGLAAGKGVVIARSMEEAEAALRDMLLDDKFGHGRVIVEDYLEGPEFSFMCFVSGSDVWPMPLAQDHKRAYDNDEGPNTGGMGTIAPSPYYTADVAKRCMEEIFLPTVEAMKKEGCPFKGCLYFGLILTEQGPKVIEYNCRFGDPETQALLPLVEGDLLEIMIATQAGTLDKCEIKLSDKSSCCLVLASGGYPEKYEKGKLITFDGDVEADCGVCIFHAGTKLGTPDSSEFVTSGGRVLGITAVRDTLEEAVRAAYAAAERVHFDGKYSRSDIGLSALRESRLKNG